MADIKNALLGVLIFSAIVFGFSIGLNDWYSQVAPSQSINILIINISDNKTTNFITSWQNQTTDKIANNPLNQVPIIGSGFILLNSIYQAMVLMLSFPSQVVMPIINGVAAALMLPNWFVMFVIAAMVVIFIIAVLNAIKGLPI